MTVTAFLLLISGVVISILTLILIVRFLRRNQLSRDIPFLSHLICPKCLNQFDYAWIPFMSLTAIRWFNLRYFACPVCGKASLFEIWNSRVDPETHNCDIRIGPL